MFNYILLLKKVKGFYIIPFILAMNIFHFNYIEIIYYYTDTFVTPSCLLHFFKAVSCIVIIKSNIIIR